MVNTRPPTPAELAELAPLERARTVIELATAEPMGRPWIGVRQAEPGASRPLLIGSEQAAIEAFGNEEGRSLWSDLMRHTARGPVTIIRTDAAPAPRTDSDG